MNLFSSEYLSTAGQACAVLIAVGSIVAIAESIARIAANQINARRKN